VYNRVVIWPVCMNSRFCELLDVSRMSYDAFESLQVRNKAASMELSPRDALPTSSHAGIRASYEASDTHNTTEAVTVEAASLELEKPGVLASETEKPERQRNHRGCWLILLVFGLFASTGFIWAAFSFWV
jgi:hypothetical protein